MKVQFRLNHLVYVNEHVLVSNIEIKEYTNKRKFKIKENVEM